MAIPSSCNKHCIFSYRAIKLGNVTCCSQQYRLRWDWIEHSNTWARAGHYNITSSAPWSC